MAYANARAIARAGCPPSDRARADAVAIACEAAPPSAAAPNAQGCNTLWQRHCHHAPLQGFLLRFLPLHYNANGFNFSGRSSSVIPWAGEAFAGAPRC